MATYREVSLDVLQPPLNPMRTESVMEGLDELKESLATNGLQQPIGVRSLGEGSYRIIWGMRRTLAAKELGWKSIPAFVYEAEEGDESLLMAHENFHRTQLNPVEEAEFYWRLIEQEHISLAECARRCRRSPAHVALKLSLLDGDPAVKEAVKNGALSQAQAHQINQVKDDPGRKFALEYAINNGMSAKHLQLWREQRDISGISTELQKVHDTLEAMPPPDMQVNLRCSLCNEYHKMSDVQQWNICNVCTHAVSEAIELWQKAKGEAA